MSWDVTLDSAVVDVGDGSDVLNITYNFGDYYRGALGFDFGDLKDQRVGDTLPALQRAVDFLGTSRDRSRDYSAGNAGYALSLMLIWGKLNPDATWDIT